MTQTPPFRPLGAVAAAALFLLAACRDSPTSVGPSSAGRFAAAAGTPER